MVAKIPTLTLCSVYANTNHNINITQDILHVLYKNKMKIKRVFLGVSIHYILHGAVIRAEALRMPIQFI